MVFAHAECKLQTLITIQKRVTSKLNKMKGGESLKQTERRKKKDVFHRSNRRKVKVITKHAIAMGKSLCKILNKTSDLERGFTFAPWNSTCFGEEESIGLGMGRHKP